jgi:Flp pilus assembly protein TadD
MFQDFELAVGVVELLMTKEPERQRVLRSAMGRLLLMLGDVTAAERHLAPVDPPDARALIDRGLAAVAQNAFQEAHDTFAKALAIEPTNVLVCM